MAANATELYIEMVYAIRNCLSLRTVTDPMSPRKSEVVEASPGRSFSLSNIEHNLVGCAPVDTVKVKALLLHFFAATELATPLVQLRNAPKFLEKIGEEYYWRGAYGAIAMPQATACIGLLREHPDTRRAIIAMDSVPMVHDVNRPCCWTSLHFIRYSGALDLLVTQRSLNLSIMPADCVVLTELLRYVSDSVSLPYGRLRWYINNLHAVNCASWDSYQGMCTRSGNLRIDNYNTVWEDLCRICKPSIERG